MKSWRITLAGLKGISRLSVEVFCQLRIVSTSVEVTLNSSQFLNAHSNKILIEKGSDSILESLSSFKEKYL